MHDHDSIKWARDNASNTYPLAKSDSGVVVLANFGRDDRSALENSVVELVHPNSEGRHRLHVISNIDPDTGSFTLKPSPVHEHWHVGAYLRRWDHIPDNNHNAVSLVKGKWIELEHGLSVLFDYDAKNDSPFQRGDYWLIPTRSIIEGALWSEADAKQGRVPDGPRHHYAPLALVTCDDKGTYAIGKSLSRSFEPQTK
jgi:hypothetical protein